MQRSAISDFSVLMYAGESKEYTLRMVCGCSLAMAGFISFSHCKLKAAHAKALQAQARPGKHGEVIMNGEPGGVRGRG